MATIQSTKSMQVRFLKASKIVTLVTFLYIGFLLISTPAIYCQEGGFKYYTNYSPKDYDHLAQNWEITQANNGIIYAANQGGVLEYDGVSWRIIGIPGYEPVNSLAIDTTGTGTDKGTGTKKGAIYIGGTNKIGFLAPDAKGKLRYISLLDHLKEDERNFSTIWRTHATNKGIYFMATSHLFRWDSRKIKTWPAEDNFRASFVCHRDFYILEKNRGLLKMVNEELELLPGTEQFARDRIYFLAPFDKYNNRELIMWVDRKGFFLYDGKKPIPFNTEVDNYLRTNILFNGIRLTNGEFALATRRGGLVIMDQQGHLKIRFDNTAGLQENFIYHICEDNRKNLWLSLDSGITKVEYGSPFSIYDKRTNLPGRVLSVFKHQDKLYAGTTNGLFYLESSSQFHLITGMSSQCWDLLSTGTTLLAATANGIFQVSKQDNRRITQPPAFALVRSRFHRDLIWCGTYEGLAALSLKNGRWTAVNRFEFKNQEKRSIAEDENGNLWLGVFSGGVLYVDFQAGIEKPAFTMFDTSHGLPEGEINAYPIAGHIVFTSRQGLYRFDKETNSFVPDSILGDTYAGGSKPVFRIIEDKNHNIWFHSESRNYHAIRQADGSFTIDSKRFRRIPTTAQVNAIYPDPGGKFTWFASQDGLIQYDSTRKEKDLHDFPTLVRRVMLNENQKNETLLYDSGYNRSGKESFTSSYPIIEYKDRNLHFEFAAPFLEAEQETQYQYILEGYDKEWSEWKKDTEVNYTNLDNGLYTFKVRARNVFQYKGIADEFQFKILPPWYKTWWAFMLYGIIFILLIYFTVRWRSYKLELDKQKLELTIDKRTKEIQEKNRQLKDQSEKLEEMDRIKSRFFANISHEFRTPLTLIMSPLEQIISKSRDKGQKQKLRVMLRNSQRLLTLINQLLELARFDSKKTRLQANCQDIVSFLKEILSAFRLQARQNQLDLEFYTTHQQILLYFDSPKLEEVIYNLLGNAVKFTPPGGKITVSIILEQPEPVKERENVKHHVKLSVKDTGVGIPQEQMVHIFNRFYQAESPKEKSRKGTGIGLSLTREIILLHHGTIDVHSQEGKGTEFEIRLPLGKGHLKPEEIIISSPPAKPHKAEEMEALYLNAENEMETGEEEIARGKDEVPEQGSGTEEKLTILVVEDDADVRRYIGDPLKPTYNVIEAADGREGIDKAKNHIPDLIISDIMMPGIDGYELCRRLKQELETSHIPIILLTAKASEESILQGLRTGANDYITKPFNVEILLSRIKNLIDLRTQTQLKLQRQGMRVPDEMPVSSLDVKFLNDFQGIVNENLSEPDFRLEDIYEKLSMARSTFFKKIKALTGKHPNQFILDYRLKRGAQLLREKYGNVTQVALAVGFNSPAYFAKCFNDKYHMSPTSYQASESKS